MQLAASRTTRWIAGTQNRLQPVLLLSNTTWSMISSAKAEDTAVTSAPPGAERGYPTLPGSGGRDGTERGRDE